MSDLSENAHPENKAGSHPYQTSRELLERWRKWPAACLTLIFAQFCIFLLPFLLGALPWDGFLMPTESMLALWSELGWLIPWSQCIEQPERFLTATALHGGFVHLALNMWGLWVLGSLLERLTGVRPFLMIYVLSALAGSVASSAYLQQLGGDGPSLSGGASGAVFGVGWSLVGVLIRRRSTLPETMHGALVVRISVVLLLGLAMGFAINAFDMSVRVDNAAHFAGSIAGLALGFLSWKKGGLVVQLGSVPLLLSLLVMLGLPLVRAVAREQTWQADEIDAMNLQFEVPRSWIRVDPEGRDRIRSWNWQWGGQTALEVRWEPPPVVSTPDTHGRLLLFERSLQGALDAGQISHFEQVYFEDLKGQGMGGVIVAHRLDYEGGGSVLYYQRFVDSPAGALSIEARGGDSRYDRERMLRLLKSFVPRS